MIFKRREKLSWRARLRDLVAPKKGWRRGFRYIGKRVQRLPDTPHRIALGFACGAMASFTPFFTLHALVAAMLAYSVRANVLAGVFGTVVGNPLTIWVIAPASLNTGNWILGRSGGVSNFDPTDLDALWTSVTTEPLVFLESIFTPYLIGGVLPGLATAAACYFAIRPLVAGFKERRRRMLAERAHELVLQRAQPRIERRLPGVRAASHLLFESHLSDPDARPCGRRGDAVTPAA